MGDGLTGNSAKWLNLHHTEESCKASHKEAFSAFTRKLAHIPPVVDEPVVDQFTEITRRLDALAEIQNTILAKLERLEATIST
jgi:hypothetical protein